MFTATFNRAHTLHGVYESLVPQTFRDFEWLVIDDGSTDDTRSLVERWEAEADFPIRYFYKPNGGLHTAWNTAVDLAQGRLFLRLDSDDACTPDALQVFYDAWESIDPGRRPVHGRLLPLLRSRGSRYRRPLPAGRVRFRLECAALQASRDGREVGLSPIEVVREYRFPELPGVSYVPESILWGRIADHYQERFINRALRVYSEDPTEQGRLSLAPWWKNSTALALREQAVLEERLRWFFYDPKYFLKAAANFSRSSWHAGDGVADQWRSLSGLAARALWLAMLPVGRLLYRRDERSRRSA